MLIYRSFYAVLTLIVFSCSSCARDAKQPAKESAAAQESFDVCFDRLFGALQQAAFAPDHFLPASANKALLKSYPPEDLQLLHADLLERQEALFAGASKAPVYVATAGGPAMGKSTILEQFMATSKLRFVYADPDRASLFYMKNTYLADLKSNKRDLQGAYTYWRDASNFIANYILAKALREGYAVAHGTTMTAPGAIIDKIFTCLRQVYGRSVHLLHVSCEPTLAKATEEKRRASGVVQCSWEDLENKGKAFFNRLPHYVKADRIDFYWRDSIDRTISAASFYQQGARLVVLDKQAWHAIGALHERMEPGVTAGTVLAGA